jgi:ribose-phosphate pyrophosphokinase
MLQIIAIATHGILSGNAIDTVNNSCLSQLVVTNTVPLGDKLERCPKMKVIDVSGTLAEAIRRYVAVTIVSTCWTDH